MDIRTQTLMRVANQSARANEAAMPKFRESLKRIFDGSGRDAQSKAETLIGGYNRRGFLRIGALTVATGTIVAACGGDDDGSSSTTTGGGGGTDTDITIARTAASVENFAVVAYDKAIANAEALGISAAVGAAATLFRNDHQAHADAFNGAVSQLGGEPYTDPNPTALSAFADTVTAVDEGTTDQAGVLTFAHGLEITAVDTYAKVGVPGLSTAALRGATQTIAQVEQLHATAIALIASDLGLPAFPSSGFSGGTEIDSSFFV